MTVVRNKHQTSFWTCLSVRTKTGQKLVCVGTDKNYIFHIIKMSVPTVKGVRQRALRRRPLLFPSTIDKNVFFNLKRSVKKWEIKLTQTNGYWAQKTCRH